MRKLVHRVGVRLQALESTEPVFARIAGYQAGEDLKRLFGRRGGGSLRLHFFTIREDRRLVERERLGKEVGTILSPARRIRQLDHLVDRSLCRLEVGVGDEGQVPRVAEI